MPPLSPLPPPPTRVLVIDDDAETRAGLRFALEDAGYAVIEATDGQRALDVLRVSPSGLVVVFDYQKPRLGGAALLLLAEREGWLTTCHAFVCLSATSHDLPAMWSCLLVRYAVPVVTKPCESDELLAAVQQAEQRLALLPILPAPHRRSGRRLRSRIQGRPR